MQARQGASVAAQPEVEELIARFAKLERPSAGRWQAEAVRQALPEDVSLDSAQPPRLPSVPAQLERGSGPLGGLTARETLSTEPNSRGFAPEWRSEVESWLMKANATARLREEAVAQRGPDERVGGELGAARDPRLGPLAESIRALAAGQRPAVGAQLEAIKQPVVSPKVAQASQFEPADYLREYRRPDGCNGEWSGLAAVAKSLEAIQGRVDIGHWPGPSELRREGAAENSRGTDSLDRLVPLVEQLVRIGERVLEALDRLGGPARAPLGSAGAGQSSVPPALPASPAAWRGRLPSGE